MDNKEAVKRLLLLLNRYQKTSIVLAYCLPSAIELILFCISNHYENINDIEVC